MLGLVALYGLLGVMGCGAEERKFGGTGAPGGAGGGGGQGGDGPGAGPQLVTSVPADGDTQASIEPYVLLYFDRPVSFASATGKIRVSSDLVPEPLAVQTFPCPDNDPTCVAGVFPDTLFGPEGNDRLAGGTNHTVTVDKSFPDPDGNTNNVDTTVSYRTFEYDLDFVDDSATLQEEVGGLDYDPITSALYACGLDSFQNDYFLIRKIPLPGGLPADPTTVYSVNTAQTGGPYCYGVDVYNGRLYAAGSYQQRVYQFNDLSAPMLPTPIVHYQTGLPVPNEVLSNVQCTADLNGTLLFGSGYFAGEPMSLIPAHNASGSWSVWLDFMNTVDLSQGFMLAPFSNGNETFVYLASQSESKLYKIDAASKAIVNEHEVTDGGLYSAQLRVDSKGRLYVGTGSGILVFDTSGTSGFTEIASRRGFDAGRFGIREEGDTVHIYFMRFRDALRIGTTSIAFN
jgi:hypothetical protein